MREGIGNSQRVRSADKLRGFYSDKAAAYTERARVRSHSLSPLSTRVGWSKRQVTDRHSLPTRFSAPHTPDPEGLVSTSSQQHSQDCPSDLATLLLETVQWIPHLEKNPKPSLPPTRSSVPVPLGLPFLPLGPLDAVPSLLAPCSEADTPSSYLKALDLLFPLPGILFSQRYACLRPSLHPSLSSSSASIPHSLCPSPALFFRNTLSTTYTCVLYFPFHLSTLRLPDCNASSTWARTLLTALSPAAVVRPSRSTTNIY